MIKNRIQKQSFIFLAFLLTLCSASAQTKVLKGVIRDSHSQELIPFASVRFRNSGAGRQADSSGAFRFRFNNWPVDTLEITSVGYQDYKIALQSSLIKGDTLTLLINMDPGGFTDIILVKTKIDRGKWLWKRIVKHKPDNDKYRFQNFSYETYNKLELDLKNVNKTKWSKNKLIRPFSFLLNNIDTTEGSPSLPAYLTESLSNFYYQKSPLKRREVFIGTKTIGIKNESLEKLLGSMDQNINFYANFIPVFNKLFIGPLSDNGDEYYKYKIADTQYVSGRRLVHFFFTPKHKGENTFEGDCWVHDTSFAIQKMSLRLSRDANINYVDKLSLIQEYQVINDSIWFLTKDKFVVDITLLGKSKLSFIGRKTTTYTNILVNDSSIGREVIKNKTRDESILPDQATNKTNEFWVRSRHEPLSRKEQGIYNMVDTIIKTPAFRRYTNVLNFLGTGYANIGSYQIGPWQNWFFGDQLEGLRLRFDLGTNRNFSKKIILHGYAAYGFKDGKWKGELDGLYLINKDPRTYIYASYSKDFDFGQNYYDEKSGDNIFALAIRKSNIPIKFIKLEEKRVDFFREWKPGLSVLLSARQRLFDPLKNLPDELNNTGQPSVPFNSFEASVRLRFAYLERFIENTFYRRSLGSEWPIIEIKYTRGIKGAFKSNYNYEKLLASLTHHTKIPPFGTLYYNLFAGRTFGTLPYVFLDIAPGNEIYYYNKYAFNLINKYEFVHDRYFGFNLEHDFGNGLFRFIPFTRKLKFRQFWLAKGLWGGLSEANKSLNFVPGNPFHSLDGKTYLEAGTGVDNILKFLRVDFIWKISPKTSGTVNSQSFGIFGSFHISF